MSAPQAARRPTAVARRRSSGSSTRVLGAIKLHSPLGPDGDFADSPTSSSGIATPLDASPMVCSAPSTAPGACDQGTSAPAAGPAGSAAAAAATDGVAQFSRHLATSRSAERWLEESLATSTSARSAQQGLPPLAASRQTAPPSTSATREGTVESAASQIVHKALRFITTDQAGPDSAKKPGFDSQSFLDKGMDAINKVGNLMEGFAITLDTVIGQAFDWGGAQPSAFVPKQRMPSAAPSSNAGAHPSAPRAAAAAPPAASGKENGGPQPSGRQPHITSFMSKLDAASEQEVQEWRKRAQQLAGELQRVRAQQEEYHRLRLQYEKLQSDLQQASTQANKLAEENCQLKSTRLPPELDPAVADPLAAQQVTQQMEALLLEKSKLVQENDRLLRENNGLQELLEFTLVHQAQLAGDGELFGYEDGELVDAELVQAGELVQDEEAAVLGGLLGSPQQPAAAVSAGEAGSVEI